MQVEFVVEKEETENKSEKSKESGWPYRYINIYKPLRQELF